MSQYPTLPPASSAEYLGATLSADKTGTNFVFYAGKDATNVELCLFDDPKDANESMHYNLTAKDPVLECGDIIKGDPIAFRLTEPLPTNVGRFILSMIRNVIEYGFVGNIARGRAEVYQKKAENSWPCRRHLTVCANDMPACGGQAS